ncbi:MAG TPA: M23 family metallopeptidase [Phenylobacterium sp.]
MQRKTAIVAAATGALLCLGLAEVAVQAQTLAPGSGVPKVTVDLPDLSPAPPQITRIVWRGADLDGDGQADIADPTGKAPRGDDVYGEGRFHARRDGGQRQHEGVDYVATPGQSVEAPISGYVARIGFAYPDDQSLRYVEIENPALHLTARVFYVDPDVAVGDAVAVGHQIGHAHTLLKRYPRGMTNHVHLELDRAGRKLNAETLITARAETSVLSAD